LSTYAPTLKLYFNSGKIVAEGE